MRSAHLKKLWVCLLIAGLVCATIVVFRWRSRDLASRFAREYRAYHESLHQEMREVPRSSLGPRTWQHLRNIADLGPQVLPYVIDKEKKKGAAEHDPFAGLVFLMITRKRFEKYEWPEGKLGDSSTHVELFVKWWEKGRRETREKFDGYYTQWKDLMSQGHERAAEQMYKSICDLGIAAIPHMVRKVEEGETRLIPAVADLTEGQLEETASSKALSKWWQENRERWVVPFPNTRPIAQAVASGQVTSGEVVMLSGSDSHDPDGDGLQYRWTQSEGPLVNLSEPAAATTSFLAPAVQKETELAFVLTVTDDAARWGSATRDLQSEPVRVRVIVKPPGS